MTRSISRFLPRPVRSLLIGGVALASLYIWQSRFVSAQNTALFPGSVVSTSDLFIASNYASSTLVNSITSTSTSATLASGSGFTHPQLVSIDNEIVNVCGVSGNVLSFGKTSCPNVDGRGYDGSTAVSHISNRPVQGRVVAWLHNQVAAEVIALETVVKSLVTENVFSAGFNGATCDNSTDDTTAFNALLTKVYNAGGGVIKVIGTCKIAGAVLLPNDGSSTRPTQPTIRITGGGPSANGYFTSALPVSPSTLNLTYNATVAKIDTRGAGVLEIDHIALQDTGTDCASFIQTTNTTVHIHDVSFAGTHFGAAACNDAVIFGGTTPTIGNGGDQAFQGYGSSLQGVFYYQTKRAFYVRCFGNNVFLDHLTWGGGTGGDSGGTVDGSCITNAQAGNGTVMSNFLEEVVGYTYGLDFVNAWNTQIFGLTQWDKPIIGFHVTGTAGTTSIVCVACSLAVPASGSWLKDDAGGTILAQYNPSGVYFGGVDATHCRMVPSGNTLLFKSNDNTVFCQINAKTMQASDLAGYNHSNYVGIGADGFGGLQKSNGGLINYPGGITAQTVNYALENGANNALVASIPAIETLTDGVQVTLRLSHSLQVGANTLNLSSIGASGIKKATDVTSNLTVAVPANSTAILVWNAQNLVWQLIGQ